MLAAVVGAAGGRWRGSGQGVGTLRVWHLGGRAAAQVMASAEKIYVVMELVPGGELFDKIVAEGRMNERQARKVLHELMDALSYCHAQGIYHRDLKVRGAPCSRVI